MGKIITTPLPHNLPENWDNTQYVSAGGIETGLTREHGYNYLMKQVNAAQKAAIQLDEHIGNFGGVNLLHNWYFKNPVNRNGGHVVPPGTPYREAMDNSITDVGTTDNYVAVTRVDDNWGSIVIGSTTYYCAYGYAIKGYSTPWKWAIDRWLCAGDGIFALYEDGAFVSGAVDQFVSIKVPAGEYTASVLLNDGNVYSTTFQYDGVTARQNLTEVAFLDLDPVTGDGERPRFRIYPLGEVLGDRKFVAIKLERGNLSTILNDIPVDFAREMAICVQYNPQTGEYVGFTDLSAANLLVDTEVV